MQTATLPQLRCAAVLRSRLSAEELELFTVNDLYLLEQNGFINAAAFESAAVEGNIFPVLLAQRAALVAVLHRRFRPRSDGHVNVWELTELTYRGLYQEYNTQRMIVTTYQPTWRHTLAAQHPQFGSICRSFEQKCDTIRDTLKLLQLTKLKEAKLIPCGPEPDHVAYNAGAKFIRLINSALLERVYNLKSEARNYSDLTKHCKTFVNNSLRDTPGVVTLPDVLSCGYDLGRLDISAMEAYAHGQIAYEYKENDDLLLEAIGECLDRGRRMRRDSQDPKRITFGTATTGVKMSSIIMIPQSGCLRGATQQVVTGNNGKVDFDKEATMDAVFAIYASLELRMAMRAGAGPLDLVTVTSGTDGAWILVSQTNEEWELQVEDLFIEFLFRGGVYCVKNLKHNDERLVLKVGPRPGAKRVAWESGLNTETWTQVETELAVRERLGKSKKIRIPEVVSFGRIKGSSPKWGGSPALLMKHCGESLIGKTLEFEEVLEMGGSLLETVSELHGAGIFHRDISPRNIGYIKEHVGRNKFYLLDMGVAVFKGGCTGEYAFDLEFSATDALLGRGIDAWSDLESILYTMLKVAGVDLPWSEAAASGDREAVVEIRSQFRISPCASEELVISFKAILESWRKPCWKAVYVPSEVMVQ